MSDAATTFIGSILKVIACTPNANDSSDEYERGVLEPAREIRRIQERLGKRIPSHEEAAHILKQLLTVLETKKVEPEERRKRLMEIIAAYGLSQDLLNGNTSER